MGEAAKNQEKGVSENVEAELEELEDFEARLQMTTWKKPKDEMRGWKTGYWKVRAVDSLLASKSSVLSE